MFGIIVDTVRISTVMAAFTDVTNDIVIRDQAGIFTSLTFGTSELSSNGDSNLLGWIAWKDPVTNPNKGAPPPNNSYEPIVGDYVTITSTITAVAGDIKLRKKDPWIWFDGTDYSPYVSIWGNWEIMRSDFKSAKYYVSPTRTRPAFFSNNFTFGNLTSSEILSRGSVYVNGTKLQSSDWTTSGSTLIVNSDLNNGDKIRAIVTAYMPTPAELAFDPETNDPDPTIIVQHKLDMPYSHEILRGESNQLTDNNYYFWVKHKKTPGRGKTTSVEMTRQLIAKHDGCYAVPQFLKYYNPKL
jgi:hypothetical protein